MERFRTAEGAAALFFIILSCFLIMVADSEVTEPEPPRTPRTPPSLVPLCISQFALVNHACSLIPYYALPPPGPPTTPPNGGFDGGDGGDGGDYGSSDVDNIDNGNNSSRVLDNDGNQNSTTVQLQRHSERNHSRNHSRSSHRSHRGSSHERRHHHRRHRSRSSQPQPSRMTATQEDCCRWLNAVDSRCVCDVLFRLPVFLSKPVHVYSVIVHDECVVTFQCPAKFIL